MPARKDDQRKHAALTFTYGSRKGTFYELCKIRGHELKVERKRFLARIRKWIDQGKIKPGEDITHLLYKDRGSMLESYNVVYKDNIYPCYELLGTIKGKQRKLAEERLIRLATQGKLKKNHVVDAIVDEPPHKKAKEYQPRVQRLDAKGKHGWGHPLDWVGTFTSQNRETNYN